MLRLWRMVMQLGWLFTAAGGEVVLSATAAIRSLTMSLFSDAGDKSSQDDHTVGK